MSADGGGHIKATWSLADDELSPELAIDLNAALDEYGCLSGDAGIYELSSGQSTYTTPDSFPAATYHVQLWTLDYNFDLHCSNVLQVSVSAGKGLILTAASVTGTVTVNGKPLAEGQTIGLGDVIKTKEDSRVEFQMEGDQLRVSVGPSSEFVIETRKKATLSLGQLWMRLTQRRFQVRTPTVCACVRGTTFTVEARKSWTRVRTYEGVVAVRNLKGKPKTVKVKAGFESVVLGKNAPASPQEFDPPEDPFWE